MYQLTITCTVCEAERSTHGLEEQPNLGDTEVLAQAGHSPSCSLQSGKAFVKREQRENVILYSIEEVQ